MTIDQQPHQDSMSDHSAAGPEDLTNAAESTALDDARDGASDEALTTEQLMQAATDRIAALQAEVEEMKQRWMRAEAENANVRSRARKDVDDTRQYAVQKFATDVVEAADNLKRGIDSLPPPSDDQPAIVAKVREGLEGVERSFLGTLERNGIKRDDPVGQPFDPNLHQAMAEQESDTQAPGTVLQAWSKAWTLNGRLLRPAMVVVAKAASEELAGSAKG
ncbi:nucleotide exchange factor GrpE [Rhodopila sp.]|uniref:nucleotide exchange factor GrpE n=1 Tax=Rhodopila sp. TaxID=2480087 RepID=UPI003D0C6657